jgi:uncharacterized Tic20 family protein
MTDENPGERLPGDVPVAGVARVPGELRSPESIGSESTGSETIGSETQGAGSAASAPAEAWLGLPGDDSEVPESESEELSPDGWPPWPELEAQNWDEVSSNEMGTYRDTTRRVERVTVAAGLLCSVAALASLGWLPAAGVLLGTLMGWLNFRWLSASVKAIGERVVNVKPTDSTIFAVARGVFRGILILTVGCAILTCSVRALVGYLAGLAMPVVALMCEAVYEFVAVNRRSS